jgi:hypothetical protein
MRKYLDSIEAGGSRFSPEGRQQWQREVDGAISLLQTGFWKRKNVTPLAANLIRLRHFSFGPDPHWFYIGDS